MGFFRHEYWSGLPFRFPGDLSDPGMAPRSPALQVDSSPDELLGKIIYVCMSVYMGFPGGSEVKASASNVGDLGSIPGLGRSPGEGNGNPLQYSCLKNPMDKGAWWATVHGVAKTQTRLSNLTFDFQYCISFQCTTY